MAQDELARESDRALMTSLENEKKHLEMALKESQQLKNQYQSKCEETHEMYEKLYKEAQTYKRDIVGVNEIKKDRDERIENLRNEINEMQGRLDTLTREHSQATVRCRSLGEENNRLTVEWHKLQEGLKLANSIRDQAESNLAEMRRQYLEV